jgi:hypothetical protein
MRNFHPPADRPLKDLVCPRCIESPVYFSRVRFWERPIIRVTGLWPLRCRRCGWRGWRADRVAVTPEPTPAVANDPADKVLDRRTG